MDTADSFYRRIFRPAAISIGLLAYVAFTAVLWQRGHMHLDLDTYVSSMVIWVAVMVALLVLPQRYVRVAESTSILAQVLWCNFGVVITAAMVPHSVRVLLLVIPLLSVFYAALRLDRSYVVAAIALTWLFYVAASLSVVQAGAVDLEFELLVGTAFTFMLAGGLLVSWEALRLRHALDSRSEELLDAMTQLQDVALRDELTGVHNRRYVLEVLQRLKSLADRGVSGFTLCYCDLDHFKRINDRYGHAVGDSVLREFAKAALGVVRNVDYVARFGGEEFILVLVDADAGEARQVAQRLTQYTRQLVIPEIAEQHCVSVSVGITAYRLDENIDDVLNRADKALYQAKREGRDRVVIAA